MPRYPRSYIQTPFFHIMTQGLNKMYIFDEESDIEYYIKTIYALLKEYDIKLISYCIMNNHAHILIEVQSIKELGKYMHRLNTRYAIYYNKKYNRVGYVFRNRYQAEGIYTEKQLYNCMNYIYNNPVKAGICKKPEDYKYSNYKKTPKSEDIEIAFIDIDNDEECEKFINDYLKDKDLDIVEIIKHKNELSEIVRILKMEFGLSLRSIAKKLNIGRETVRKIFKE